MTQTRRLAAILAADVAGYSRLMGADEEGTLERLKALRHELVDPMIADHRGPLDRYLIGRIVSRVGRAAGVPGVHPHRLRHTLATETLRAGAPMAEVAQLLRHADQATSSIYAAADVFMFPSKTDTFGLVLLEALASGLPVAAFPVTGPRDVIGAAPVGALNDDLRAACLSAMTISPQACREFAAGHSWEASARAFVDNMTDIRTVDRKDDAVPFTEHHPRFVA